MRTTTPHKLGQLQKNAANIRNICMLAHVDHGKTTLADTLVASNGIISNRMVGKLRYLDSREDEQQRGITMKSSAISLHYAQQDEEEYLINLIDSPGHVDFSSEVSTAVRLCDGAVVLVDVVEGVCPQTQAVLRQAWLEHIKPVLVLNKMDRLILELKMSPLEAHLHLTQILEQVNAITGELFTSGVLEKTSQNGTETLTPEGDMSDKVYDWSSGVEETDDANLYFSPDQGNVVFASALDGWGFGIKQFADLFSKKLGMSAAVLKKTLWGDFYFEAKTKKVRKGAQGKAKKPMFVQFILENLWSVYDMVMVRRDKEKTEKIITSMNLTIQARDLRHNDPRVLLLAIASQWLPLPKSVLEMVVDFLPSPINMPVERVEKLLCPVGRKFESLPQQTQTLKDSFLACSADDEAPVVVYISKMFSIDKKALPVNRHRPLTQKDLAERREIARQKHAEKRATEEKAQERGSSAAESQIENGAAMLPLPDTSSTEPEVSKEEVELDQVFVAFARIFSGTVRLGQTLYIMGPKHDPSKALSQCPDGKPTNVESLQYVTQFIVKDLYTFMGRELDNRDQVPAGNILGLSGLEDIVVKSGTMSSTLACPAFTDMHFEAAPIVRVAIEPTNASDMGNLVRGMRLLNQSDPCVQALLQSTGEFVIVAAGEVHLQKCLDDLEQKYAKIKVNASAPTVPFRETIISPPKLDMVNEAIEVVVNKNKPNHPKASKDEDEEDSSEEDHEDEEVLEPGLVQSSTRNRTCTFRTRAIPLPTEVTDLLETHVELIKILNQFASDFCVNRALTNSGVGISEETLEALTSFKSKLETAFSEAGKQWVGAVDHIWSFGPKRSGPNILLNRIEGYDRTSIWSCLHNGKTESTRLRDYDSTVIGGFQLATQAGPICLEPVRGVCYSIEAWEFHIRTRLDSEHPTTPEDLTPPILEDVPEVAEDSLDISQIKMEELATNIKGMTLAKSESGSNVIAESCPDLNLPNIEKDSKVTFQTEEPADKTHKIVDKTRASLTGQVMYCVLDGCKKAFQSQPQRIVAAMYTCSIQATADVLGKLYAVLGKRNGRVTMEDLREGTSIFNITAMLPVVESFGFTEDMRKRTSGLASPQLKFSHWEVIEMDPYWVPTTEEEYMHFGEKADSANLARKYMNDVRRRKGLFVDEQLVETGTKQRTRSRKK